MKFFTIFTFTFLLISYEATAETDLYSELSTIFVVKDNFYVVTTATGIDLNSKNTFKNSKGKVEPVTHLMLEGPLNYPKIGNLQQGIFATADVVKGEVDSAYKNKQELYPGLGVDLVDINGTQVGILNYKMNREPNTYVKRAIIYTSNGLYTYTIIMHQSKPKSKAGLTLMVLLIAAVNTSKL